MSARIADVVPLDLARDHARRGGGNTDGVAAMSRQALEILYRGGKDAYRRAVAALHPETRGWWAEQLEAAAAGGEEGERYGPTAEDLERFLLTAVAPADGQVRLPSAAHEALRRQACGQSLGPNRAGRLQAHNLHLDRQLERTLPLRLDLQAEFPLGAVTAPEDPAAT
jgi:hypothetical protein